MEQASYIIPQWSAPNTIGAISTNRIGGYSQTPYDQLNLSYNVGDDPKKVAKNHEKLIKAAKIPNTPSWLQQVHGNRAIKLTSTRTDQPQADASFTDQPNIVCAVMTADCLPILLCSQSGQEVAAIHAGWRGLASGIIQNTIACMQTPAPQILAWLGPAIGPAAFTVGPEVVEKFTQVDTDLEPAFQQQKQQWHANLSQIAQLILNKLNVKQIVNESICTYSNPQRFFSYRQQQQKTGRMASLIWINER